MGSTQLRQRLRMVCDPIFAHLNVDADHSHSETKTCVIACFHILTIVSAVPSI